MNNTHFQNHFSRFAVSFSALSLSLVGASAVVGQNAEEKKAMSVSAPEEDTSPDAELAAFELTAGYKANLFADETDGISNPICMNWDPAGRLWVLCSSAYPQLEPDSDPDDQLIILEDTDQDGRADKKIVFARGLNMPMGFALGHGGVYVGEGKDPRCEI